MNVIFRWLNSTSNVLVMIHIVVNNTRVDHLLRVRHAVLSHIIEATSSKKATQCFSQHDKALLLRSSSKVEYLAVCQLRIRSGSLPDVTLILSRASSPSVSSPVTSLAAATYELR